MFRCLYIIPGPRDGKGEPQSENYEIQLRRMAIANKAKLSAMYT